MSLRITNLEDLIGRTLVFGIPGTRVRPEDVRLFQETRAAGLILYRINFVSPAQIRRLIKDIKAPVLINQVEGGKTPLFTAKQLQDMGAAVGQYCTPSFFVLAKALKNFYKVLREKGTSRDDMDMMETFPPFNKRLNLQKYIALDDKYLKIEKEYKD